MVFSGKILNKKEQQEIKERVEEFENATGAELVLAIAHESDPYPGSVLRVSIFFALFATLLLSYFVEFSYPYLYVLSQFIFTFLFLPLGRINAVKSLALVDSEVDREVSEKAVEVFFTYCSEKSGHSNEALIYTSLFEKKIEVLVGTNLKERLSQNDLEEVVSIIKDDFSHKNYLQAYRRAIASLEEKVKLRFPDKVSDLGADDLSNDIIWIKNA
ncbi:MAG: hypothetical protein WD025_01660 [Bacteriovoracaceae bacterium]